MIFSRILFKRIAVASVVAGALVVAVGLSPAHAASSSVMPQQKVLQRNAMSEAQALAARVGKQVVRLRDGRQELNVWCDIVAGLGQC